MTERSRGIVAKVVHYETGGCPVSSVRPPHIPRVKAQFTETRTSFSELIVQGSREFICLGEADLTLNCPSSTHENMNLGKTLVASLALFSAGALITPEVQAADWIIKEDSKESRPIELGILVALGGLANNNGGLDLSPGVLVGIPLVDGGFVPINDSFYLEVGGWSHIGLDPSYFDLTALGGVRWNFHLMEIWDAYGALRLGARLGLPSNDSLSFDVQGVAGTTWKFSKKIGLRGELGGGVFGGSLAAGIDIDF